MLVWRCDRGGAMMAREKIIDSMPQYGAENEPFMLKALSITGFDVLLEPVTI